MVNIENFDKACAMFNMNLMYPSVVIAIELSLDKPFFQMMDVVRKQKKKQQFTVVQAEYKEKTSAHIPTDIPKQTSVLKF